jgi:hypothetical protein
MEKMKGFTKDTSGQFKSLAIGAQDVQNHDGTFGFQVVDAALCDPRTRTNKFFSLELDAVSGTHLDNIEFRPRALVRSMLRLRNSSTGNFNASTATLNLATGSGGSGAGNIFAFTWRHLSPQDDNLTGILLWAKRSASAANSKIRAALFDITALCQATPSALLTTPASGINVTPFTLDRANYYTAALAYTETTFDSVSSATNGGPLYLNLNYNSKEDRTVVLKTGKVYAVVLYLVRSGVETGNVAIYGSETQLSNEVGFYAGAAGWGGSLALDTTVKIPFHKIFTHKLAVLNQIHIYAQSPNNLGGTILESFTVDKNGDQVMTDVPDANGFVIEREVVGRLNLANERRHSIMFEGKVVIPRGYHLDMLILPGYTGKLWVEVNYWISNVGDESKLK